MEGEVDGISPKDKLRHQERDGHRFRVRKYRQ